MSARQRAAPGDFATLGVPIVAGRDFTLTDARQGRHVVKPFEMMPATVINETFAHRHFPGRNPIGLHIGLGAIRGRRLTWRSSAS